MGVFREMTVTWDGVDYQITPDMRTLRQIESQDISIADIAHRTAKGQAPTSHIAFVLSVLLTQAGATDCDENEVYAAIMGGNQKQAMSLISTVLSAFAPDVKPKKHAAPRTKLPKARRATA